MFYLLFSNLPATFSEPQNKFTGEIHLDLQQKEMDKCIQKCRDTLQEHCANNPRVLKMFDETLNQWKSYYVQNKGHFDIHRLLNAINFAAIKHEGQYRKDAAATPYIIHPMGVARSLWEEGQIRSLNVLIAALLHDTLEDTDTTADEIEKCFGPRVRYTVEELTNDPNLSSLENKQRQVDHAPHLSLNAQLVKLADRLYNIRDLRSPPPNWDENHINSYFNWGQKLLNALKGTNERLEQALQEEILNHSGFHEKQQ